MSSVPKCRTAGCIARDTGYPLWRVQYVLKTRPHIRPIGTAGNLRIFDAAAANAIEEELRRIDAKREDSSRG